MTRKLSTLNILSAILCIVLLVLQFMPFWHFTTDDAEQSVSIQGYVWFPEEHKDLDSHLSEEIGESHSLNGIIAMPVAVLIFGAAGAILCLVKHDFWAVSIAPTICGAVGVWGYLARAAFQLGSGWGLHLAVSIAILACGVLALAAGVKELVER